MSWTSKKTANLGTSSTVNATQRARAASSAAAANAASAAHSAAIAAQNAASFAQTAAQNSAVIAANAARSASGAAQTAASGTTKGVRQGAYSARSWAAPRLDSAADYFTATAAPKVSSALRTTARRVSPADTTSSKRSSILAWSVLGAAGIAAVGAGAAIVRYRYRAAIAADSEAADEEIRGDSTASQPAPATPDGTRSATATPAEPKTKAPVNRRVSLSDR